MIWLPDLVTGDYNGRRHFFPFYFFFLAAKVAVGAGSSRTSDIRLNVTRFGQALAWRTVRSDCTRLVLAADDSSPTSFFFFFLLAFEMTTKGRF